MTQYQIKGEDVQYLEIELNAGESVYVEPGHLVYKDAGMRLDVGSGGLRGALSHMLAGSAIFLIKMDGPGTFASAGFLPGKIFDIELNGNSIYAEFNAFLAMDSSITYSTKFAGVSQAIFGGEGVFLEKFSGTGKLYLHGHGQVIERELKPGEEIQVEMSHVLAFEETVGYKIQRIGGVKTMLLAGLEGEGLFFANMRGPGKVWIHSISLLQLAAKLVRR